LPLCSEVTPGQKKVAHLALMVKSNIYLPQHIKPGLIKILMKAMDKEIEGFAYLRQKFPKISEAKLKEGIFNGPQINKLIEDHDFSTKLNDTERRDWEVFENVHRNFLSTEKVENYGEILQDLISSYSAVGCSMSLNLHFFAFPFGFFPLKTWEWSPMNMVKGSTRTFPKWKTGRVDESKYVGLVLLESYNGDTNW
jgi:hypothetical protein